MENNIKFKKPFPWSCPQFIDGETKYYIGDKYIANNLYEYALFSVPARGRQEKAGNKYEALFVLNGQKIEDKKLDSLVDAIIRRYVINQYSDMAIVRGTDDKKYTYNFKTGKLTEMFEPVQETGWMGYLECLNTAKEIIKQRQPYKQQTLFDL